jgi:HAD superfamily hydrolase (TIGR01509 family)
MNTQLAVIFDMDGVIIDSNPLIAKAWTSFFAEHGIRLTPAQLNQYVYGRSAQDTFRHVFQRELPAAEVQAYTHAIEAHVRALYQREGTIVPGFGAFVASLQAANVRLGLATSGTPEDIALVFALAGLSQEDFAITGSTQVSRHKPFPDVYLQTAAQLHVEPARCLVFEDAYAGAQAARRAGMQVIGLTTTHTAAELAAYTDGTVADFTGLTATSVQELLACHS